MNKEVEKLELEKAEQQILGFYHSYQGFGLKDLCKAMGLSDEEYKEMVELGMLDYLPQDLRDEILEYINE